MKLKQTLSTEIFVSMAGYAAIKQDEGITSLSPEQIPYVIEELQRLHATASEWWQPCLREGGGEDGDEPEDPAPNEREIELESAGFREFARKNPNWEPPK